MRALAKLLPAMLPKIDLPRALLRGRYTAAVARMEWIGTPIDVETLGRLREHWAPIKSRLRFGVQRKAAYNGLAALEAAGLVAVDRHRGRCPVVTILDFHGAEETAP